MEKFFRPVLCPQCDLTFSLPVDPILLQFLQQGHEDRKMSTPEGKFKKDTRDEFVKLPTTWLHIADALMKKGIPDVMGGLRGRLFGLELKVDTPVTKIQKVTLEYMHQGGAWTGIARKVIEAPRRYHIVLSDRMEQNPLYFTDEHHLVEYIWSQCFCGVYISDQM